jgi:hypothetical protein
MSKSDWRCFNCGTIKAEELFKFSNFGNNETLKKLCDNDYCHKCFMEIKNEESEVSGKAVYE